MHRILPVLVAALMWGACSLVSESRPPPAKVEAAELLGHWVHSREEETPGRPGQLYRPDGYRAFPPSRFRMQYVFKPDGQCDWFYLAPNDGHHFRAGAWRVANDTLVVEQGEQTVTYRILEHGPEVLRLHPLAP